MSSAAVKALYSPAGTVIEIVKWKVRKGSKVDPGSVLMTYKIEGSGEIKKLKSQQIGGVVELLQKEGDLVQPRQQLLKLAGCSHNIVIKDLCAECGKDLRDEREEGIEDIALLTEQKVQSNKASVAMIHCVPELVVTDKHAEEIGQADLTRLKKSKKLVLLVDLDQTLIHTTTDNIPNNLKGAHHFTLGKVWYHTMFRPGTEEFLRSISKLYELHIVTFGVREYAHTIARIMDREGKYFSHRILSRDELLDGNTKKANLKSLFPCGEDMVAIIDDREDVWNYSDNVIHVLPYKFFTGTGDINAPGKQPNANPALNSIPSANQNIPNTSEETNSADAAVNNKSSVTETTHSSDTSNDTVDVVPAVRSAKRSAEERDPDRGKKSKLDDASSDVAFDELSVQTPLTAAESVLEGVSNEKKQSERKDNQELTSFAAEDSNKDNQRNENHKSTDSACTATSKKLEKADEDASTELKDKGTSKEAKDTAAEVEDNSKEVKDTAAEVKDTVAEVKDTAAEVKDTAAEVKDAAAEVNDTAAEVKDTSVEVKDTSVEVKDNSEKVKDTPKETKDNSGEVKDTPKEVKDTPKEVNDTPKEVKDNSKEVKDTSAIEVKDTSAEGMNKPNELSEVLNDAKPEEKIEWPDDDNYLQKLTDILVDVHHDFYNIASPVSTKIMLSKSESRRRTVAGVLATTRKQVLDGCVLAFSGLFPQSQSLYHSTAYSIAINLGAEVTVNVESNVTHLVASRLGTRKVRQAATIPVCTVVHPDWLWLCWYNIHRENELRHMLSKDNEIPEPKATNIPFMCGKYDPSFGRKRKLPEMIEVSAEEIRQGKIDDVEVDYLIGSDDDTVIVGEDEELNASGEVVARRFSDTVNPLLGFDREDIDAMDAEIDDAFDELSSSDESEDNEAEGNVSNRDKLLRKKILSSDENNSDSEESLTADYPKGWGPKDKNKRSSPQHDEYEELAEEEYLRMQEDAENSPMEINSSDDEEDNLMAAELDKAFLD